MEIARRASDGKRASLRSNSKRGSRASRSSITDVGAAGVAGAAGSGPNVGQPPQAPAPARPAQRTPSYLEANSEAEKAASDDWGAALQGTPGCNRVRAHGVGGWVPRDQP